jgi:protein-L-isoaspartate(D-aspartate) O-methyltransferase
VLEVGSGSGYATAILARLVHEVVAIERHEALAGEARETLAELQIGNVDLRCGDGTLGVPDLAPFDVIIVSASGPDVPPSLMAQLAPGGRLIMPVGSQHWTQSLIRLEKDAHGAVDRTELCGVQFVPLMGAEGHRP